MKRSKLPLSLCLVKGAIGKKFVIKHYAYGIVKTKFPKSSNVLPTAAQYNCRSNFKAAVLFAKEILADANKLKCWQQRLKVKYRLFNALIKHYLITLKTLAGKAISPVKPKSKTTFVGLYFISPSHTIKPIFPINSYQNYAGSWPIIRLPKMDLPISFGSC
jgi:hypothetical protein